MRPIRGRFALLTGASRGIGPFIARALAAQGVNLVLSARSVEGLEHTAAAARAQGVSVTFIPADLRRRADLESLAEQAEANTGGISLLINNAGIETALPFDRVDPRAIDDTLAVNLTAPMVLTRLLLPGMIARGEGHVVNIASLAGLVGTPYEETYAASKAGLIGFSRSLGQTMKSEGHRIGVSVICPGFISQAGMYQKAADATGGTAPFMIGTVPVEKVADAVVDAILHDQPEVVLAGKPMRPFLVIQSLSPSLTARLSTMVGVPAMFKRWADASLRAREKKV